MNESTQIYIYFALAGLLGLAKTLTDVPSWIVN